MRNFRTPGALVTHITGCKLKYAYGRGMTWFYLLMDGVCLSGPTNFHRILGMLVASPMLNVYKITTKVSIADCLVDHVTYYITYHNSQTNDLVGVGFMNEPLGDTGAVLMDYMNYDNVEERLQRFAAKGKVTLLP